MLGGMQLPFLDHVVVDGCRGDGVLADPLASLLGCA